MSLFIKQPTNIILSRHGQTEYNFQHRLDGNSDTQLTKLGYQQAAGLAKCLQDQKIDVIITSSLSRSIETAEIVKRFHSKVPLIIVPEFNEIDCGELTGLSQSEIQERYPDLVREWAKNTDPPFPGGESLRDVQQRSWGKFRELARRYHGKTMLIIGHGSLNIGIIGKILKIPAGLCFNIKQSNCCINKIVAVGGSFSVKQVNMTKKT